jgi:hypothetical protein
MIANINNDHGLCISKEFGSLHREAMTSEERHMSSLIKALNNPHLYQTLHIASCICKMVQNGTRRGLDP